MGRLYYHPKVLDFEPCPSTGLDCNMCPYGEGEKKDMCEYLVK